MTSLGMPPTVWPVAPIAAMNTPAGQSGHCTLRKAALSPPLPPRARRVPRPSPYHRRARHSCEHSRQNSLHPWSWHLGVTNETVGEI